MKDTILYLKTCSTCQRILKELDGLLEGVELQNIKKEPVSTTQLDYIAGNAGGYEAVFNKRAMKYKTSGLKEKELTESEWREHILSEYTYMKRPLSVIDGEVYAGNSKSVTAALKEALVNRK